MAARQKPKHLQRFVPKESAIVESTKDPSCKTRPGREGMLSYRRSHQIPISQVRRVNRPIARTKSTNALSSMVSEQASEPKISEQVSEPKVSEAEEQFDAPWRPECPGEWDMSPINPDDEPQLIYESMYFEGFDWDWREEAWRQQQAAQSELESTTESAESVQTSSASATQGQDRDQSQGQSEPESDQPTSPSRPHAENRVFEDDSGEFGTSEHVEYVPEAAEIPARRSPRLPFPHFYFS